MFKLFKSSEIKAAEKLKLESYEKLHQKIEGLLENDPQGWRPADILGTLAWKYRKTKIYVNTYGVIGQYENKAHWLLSSSSNEQKKRLKALLSNLAATHALRTLLKSELEQ